MISSSKHPYIFDEFFASGGEESVSPFLTPKSRKWGKNLTLKSALFSALLLALAFGFSFVHPATSNLFLAGVFFLVGTPALIGSLEDLKNLEINIDVLMTVAALLSITIGSGLEGALLLVLFELSASMENAASQKTRSALLNLRQIAPKMAFVFDESGAVYERSIREIPVGSRILIKAGEIVPLDGVVIEGSSFVNLAHLTGESRPVSKRNGEEIPAGALNLEGTLTLKVTRTSRDSTLTRIIELITSAQSAKPTLERFLDRFGKWYALTIIGLFFLFALALPWVFSMPYLGPEGSIYRALTFLIAASPCALIIATPTAYLSSISSCAKKGIMLKGGVILDALSRCSIIAFDKTGTLTTGQLTCTDMQSFPELPPVCSTQQALAIAAGLEKHTVHPIADAICAYAQKEGIPPIEIEHFQSKAGFGLEGLVSLDGEKASVFIGHPDYIEQKISPALKETWDRIRKQIHAFKNPSTLLLIKNSLYAFHFKDEIRAECFKTLPKLKVQKGCRLLMVTGDHTDHARQVAEELSIDEIYANLRPEDKLNKVAELSKTTGLIMVGDGINDAPALARATVGISLGKIASATAVDASDIVFLSDDLSLLDWLISKAQLTRRIVRQNLGLALSVIVFATTPALLGLVPLWMAVILHEGGTVLVGLNSLRLLKS